MFSASAEIARVASFQPPYSTITSTGHETDPAVWDQTFDVNLRGTFLCCKYAVLQMMRQGGGVIVNTASTSSLMPGVCPVYDASKSAVLQLTRVIAAQYAARDIRCNAVAPGGTATPLVAHPNFRSTSERFGSVAPMLRPPFSQPEQIAPAFVFLASDDASYLTGAFFPVDAGMTALPGRRDRIV